jgi:hypothetical protein
MESSEPEPDVESALSPRHPSIEVSDEDGGEASALMTGLPSKHRKESFQSRCRRWLLRHFCVVLLVVALLCSILTTIMLQGGGDGSFELTEEQTVPTLPHLPAPGWRGCEWASYKSFTVEVGTAKNFSFVSKLMGMASLPNMC